MSTKRMVGRLIAIPVIMATVVAVIGTTTASAAPRHTGVVVGGESGSLGRLGPLTDLVIQRLLVGDEVAASKFGTDKPIDDPAREQQELAEVRQSAVALGIDPDAAVAFFRQQISASKVVQRGLFDRWTAHPDQAPTTRPDLNQIREELDRLTTDLLDALVADQDVLSAGLACRVDLGLAALSGAVVHHLDGLHRRALHVALASTCV